MLEPNSAYFLEGLRRFWYRMDPQTDPSTEHALNHSQLLQQASPYFERVSCRYLGGPAYFLILNSMMTRVPLWIKPTIADPLFFLESIYARIPFRWMHSLFLAQWRRTEVPVMKPESQPAQK